MKRSNVWRDPLGRLWERRHGGVDFGVDFGAAFRLYADGRASYRKGFYTPEPTDDLPEAWAVLIGDPLPVPATEAQGPPKKRPRKFRDSDGNCWVRGFRRGEVLLRNKKGPTWLIWEYRGEIHVQENWRVTAGDLFAARARAAIVALWPDRKSS